jgi:hypothetical protein
VLSRQANNPIVALREADFDHDIIGSSVTAVVTARRSKGGFFVFDGVMVRGGWRPQDRQGGYHNSLGEGEVNFRFALNATEF